MLVRCVHIEIFMRNSETARTFAVVDARTGVMIAMFSATPVTAREQVMRAWDVDDVELLDMDLVDWAREAIG